MSWWTPEHLPHGRRQAGDRHLNFHKDWDNLTPTPGTDLWDECRGSHETDRPNGQ
jgi:hypothetical protein